MQQVPVLVPQSSYGDGNTTVVIAIIYCILRGCYDVVWGTLEFPSFNFKGIFDGFCILKGMSYMMPLSRHALSLQTGLHRLFILGTVTPPTPSEWNTICDIILNKTGKFSLQATIDALLEHETVLKHDQENALILSQSSKLKLFS